MLNALAVARQRVIDLLHRDKKTSELKYWKAKSGAEGGNFKHAHYDQFYTNVFGLTHADYEIKRVLDIGCGPRGSLEWAAMTKERIGLDPLAVDYLKLRVNKHEMSYVAAASEHIPFADGHFDFVTSFNSLDHVDDLQKTISEIKRIVTIGGLLLLIVEINHPPTPTEPITLRRDVVGFFAPEFAVEKCWVSELLPGKHDVYGSVLAMKEPNWYYERAILCARMRRT